MICFLGQIYTFQSNAGSLRRNFRPSDSLLIDESQIYLDVGDFDCKR